MGIEGHSNNLPDSGEVTHNEIRFWSNQAILEVLSLFLLPFPKIFWHLIKNVQNTAKLDMYHIVGSSHYSDCE